MLVTDKLRSYGAARSEMGLSARHEQGLRKNNRAENSHQPTRRRERKMQRSKSPGSSPALLVRSRRRSQHVQRPTPSHFPPPASRPKRRSVPDVASRHRGLKFSGPSKPRAAPIQVGVTAPEREFAGPDFHQGERCALPRDTEQSGRIRIKRPDGGSARCNASRARAQPRSSSQPTPPSTTLPTPNAISRQLKHRVLRAAAMTTWREAVVGLRIRKA
jgi:hypothetical protein